MKDRIEFDNNDNYDHEIMIKRIELEIKEFERKNHHLHRANQKLIKHSTSLHHIAHHRVTLEDESKYTMQYKNTKKEVDLLLAKNDQIRDELDRMTAV